MAETSRCETAWMVRRRSWLHEAEKTCVIAERNGWIKFWKSEAKGMC